MISSTNKLSVPQSVPYNKINVMFVLNRLRKLNMMYSINKIFKVEFSSRTSR